MVARMMATRIGIIYVCSMDSAGEAVLVSQDIVGVISEEVNEMLDGVAIVVEGALRGIELWQKLGWV